MTPQIIPLTSDTPRLHQPVSRSPVARRYANALSTKAAQITMVLRHHERRVATRSAHTLEANISHDTANHPAHQRHAVSRSPVAQRHANTLPTKAAQIPMALQHHERNFATRSAHTLQANRSHDAAFTPGCFAHGTAPRKHTSHQGRATPNGRT